MQDFMGYGKRTKVRWNIAILMWAVIAINFIDRTNLSAAAPVLEKQFHISTTEMGIVMSSFFWSYVVFMIPAGWLADKVGQRISLTISCIWWSISTMLTALARGTGTLILIRLIMGIGESGAYPANAGITAKWFPIKERARVAGIFDSGNKIGSALAMPLVVWLLTRFGWQAPFIVSGILGLIWVGLWWSYYRDPDKHRYANRAELDFIRPDAMEASMEAGGDRLKWYQVLCHRNILSMCIGFFMLNYTSYFFITWFPSYLVQARGMSLMTMGGVAMIPPICGILGDFMGGWFSDFLVRKGISITAARKVNLVGGMLIATTVALAGFTSSAVWSVVLLSICTFGLQCAGCVVWALPSHVAPKNAVSVVAGLQGAVSNCAGILGPIVTGVILATTHSFVPALLISGFACLLGAAIYLFGLGRIEPISQRTVQDTVSAQV